MEYPTIVRMLTLEEIEQYTHKLYRSFNIDEYIHLTGEDLLRLLRQLRKEYCDKWLTTYDEENFDND